MKSPIPFLVLMPLPPILWCCWSVATTGSVERVALLITLGLAFLGWCGAWFSASTSRKLVKRRHFVDIHPNHVTVTDGSRFDGKFSSSTILIADPTAFHAVMHAVAERTIPENKLFSMKESVHIRIWPATLRISPEEVAAVGALADELFVNPEVEIVGPAGDDRTAIHA